MEQNIVVCINREYGSGGRAIGEMLANDLGVHYYDKEILKLASDDSGINETLFVSADVNFRTGPPLFRTPGRVYQGELLTPGDSEFTSEQNLFNYQAKVIKELADRESCVIVGRCGGFILRNRPNVVRVFVHAPHEYLVEHAAEIKSLPQKELERYVDKMNKKRADYFRTYTGRQWNDAENYDLCLDSSKLSREKCVEIIKGYMKVRFGR